MQIKGRTFIVSGGSSGLGEATTALLLANGAYVAIFDLNEPTSISAGAQSRVLFITTDVSSTASLQDALKRTLSWTQKTTASLSGVCLCAGIGRAALALPRQPPNVTHDTVKYYDMSAFDKVHAINHRGTVDLIRLTLPHIALNEPLGEDNERGVIIIVSSVAAFDGQVGQLAYSASKGAVASIVLPLARELGQKAGIRVMGIAPGAFDTNMTNQHKAKGQPSTVAEKKQQETQAAQWEARVNPEMAQYPKRRGHASEFARLVKDIIENPYLNGTVIRLDGAVRMPSRL